MLYRRKNDKQAVIYDIVAQLFDEFAKTAPCGIIEIAAHKQRIQDAITTAFQAGVEWEARRQK